MFPYIRLHTTRHSVGYWFPMSRPIIECKSLQWEPYRCKKNCLRFFIFLNKRIFNVSYSWGQRFYYIYGGNCHILYMSDPCVGLSQPHLVAGLSDRLHTLARSPTTQHGRFVIVSPLTFL